MEKCEYEENGKCAEISYPVFQNDQINQEIRKTVDGILNNFLLYSAENSYLKMESEIKHQTPNLVSLIIDDECIKNNEGHPEKLRYALSYDLENKKLLTISDFLIGDEWHKTANNIMKEKAEKNSEYDELWEIPTIEILDKENFFIKDGKIIVFYPPYKLSYYNRGFVEFEFSAEDMRGFLSDYAKNHIK